MRNSNGHWGEDKKGFYLKTQFMWGDSTVWIEGLFELLLLVDWVNRRGNHFYFFAT